MSGKIHYEGQSYFGSVSLKNQAQSTLYIGLYTNSSALTKEQTMTDISEVSGGGYSRVELDILDWVEEATKTVDQGTLFSHIRKTFLFNSAVGNVYGYFITDVSTGTGNLIVTEHFPNAVNVNQEEFEIRITPKIEIR